MNPASILQTQYPQSDLLPYFRFLTSQIGTPREKGKTHDHHICPREQFPELENEPSNILTLTVKAHAEAHRLLAESVPELRDNSAWIEASQMVDHVKCGRQSKENGTGIFAPGMCPAKAGRIGGLIGGCITGRQSKENGTGIFAPGMQVKGGLAAAHKRWHVGRGIVSSACELCSGE